MKCGMECTKKAKLKISLSGSGRSEHLCYRHAFMFVKTQMQRLGTYDFGIYIQRPPSKDVLRHEREMQGEREKRAEQMKEHRLQTAPVQVAIEESWDF